LETEDVSDSVACDWVAEHEGTRWFAAGKSLAGQGANTCASQARVCLRGLGVAGGNVGQRVVVRGPGRYARHHGRSRDGVWVGLGAVKGPRLLCVGGIWRVWGGTAGVASHGKVLGGPQYGAAVSSTAVFRGAAWSTGWQSVTVLLGENDGAVFARLRVRVEGVARSPATDATGGGGIAGEIWVVCGRAGACGRRLEGRRQALGQIEGGVVEDGVIRRAFFGWGRDAWIARAARRGRRLSADDGRRTVNLTEVGQRDLCACCEQPVAGGAPQERLARGLP
jgi:hypothetical protein